MAIGATNSDRNYLDIINGTASDKKVNAKFKQKGDDDISVQDFFNMMVTQLTNQDFMNPMSDTEYMSQMAQFSTMQEMMDLCQYSKQNYAMSMLGKNVTLTSHEVGGNAKEITGNVEKIGIENGEYKVYINGTPYDYSKVTSINYDASSVKPAAEAKPVSDTDKTEKADSEEKTEAADV